MGADLNIGTDRLKSKQKCTLQNVECIIYLKITLYLGPYQSFMAELVTEINSGWCLAEFLTHLCTVWPKIEFLSCVTTYAILIRFPQWNLIIPRKCFLSKLLFSHAYFLIRFAQTKITLLIFSNKKIRPD